MKHYACCEHCRPERGGFHPMKRNEHIGPCPQGCNDTRKDGAK